MNQESESHSDEEGDVQVELVDELGKQKNPRDKNDMTMGSLPPDDDSIEDLSGGAGGGNNALLQLAKRALEVGPSSMVRSSGSRD